MRKIIFVLTVAINLISCEKNKIESPEIQIELMDDVSPVLVKLSVDNRWERYEWKFNDYYYPSMPVKNEAYFIFPSGETSKVSLKVYDGDDFVIVEKEFITPPLPSKLKFYGMILNKDILFSKDCKTHFAIFKFYKENELNSTYDSTFINITSNSIGDTLFFKTPVEYDISNYISNTFNNHIDIGIDGCQKGTSLFWGESLPVLGELCFARNRYDPKKFRVGSSEDSSPSKYLDLLVDWMP